MTDAKRRGDQEEDSRPLRTLAVSALLLLILVDAVWNRWPLVREGLWRDEAISVYIASAPSSRELFRRLETNDFNPPLFYALLAGWGRLAGWNEASLKLYALGWGILAIGVVGLLAGRFFGWRGGVLGLALAAANPLLFRMSGELRPYTLSVVAGALALALTDRRWREDAPRATKTIGLAAALAVLAYSHYAGLLVLAVVGAAGLAGLVAGVKRKQSIGTVLAASLAGLLFLPWLPVFWRQVRTGIPYDRPLGWGERLEFLRRKLAVVLPVFDPQPSRWICILVALALVVAVAWRPADVRRELRASAARLSLLAVSALAVFLAMGLAASNPRYLSLAAALGSALLAGVLAVVWTATAGQGALGALPAAAASISLLLCSYGPLAAASLEVRMSVESGVPKSAIRSLCAQKPPPPDDLVVVAPDFVATTFWYYCGRRSDIHGFAQWDEPMLPDWERYARLWLSPTAVSDAIERIERTSRASGRRRLVFVSAPPPQGTPLGLPVRIRALRKALAAQYRSTGESVYPGRIEQIQVSEFDLEKRFASGEPAAPGAKGKDH